MSQFTFDNAWQQGIRDAILKPFYKIRAFEGRFIFADKGKLADILQKEMEVDTILQRKENEIQAIEEKIVRWPGYRYESYTLEIMSCTVPGRERQGWMHYSKCDTLLYCFVQENGSIIAHALPFTDLQKWFFENKDKYKSTFTKQINRTECKLVPIADVFENVERCKIFVINKLATPPARLELSAAEASVVSIVKGDLW
jgi:hypothetical protein